MDYAVNFVPASPGYFVLVTTADENDSRRKTVYHDPVIAWRLSLEAGRSRHAFAFPITVGNDPSDRPVILTPYGKVVIAGLLDFDSINDYIAYLNNKPAI